MANHRTENQGTSLTHRQSANQEKVAFCRLCQRQGSLRQVAGINQGWFLCSHCLLLQKVPLATDHVEVFRQNEIYRAKGQGTNLATYQERVNTLGTDWQHYVKRTALPANIRVLDFGSGNGAMLEYLRQQHVDAVGIEPSRAYAAFSRERGHEVVNGVLQEGTFPEEYFDVVHIRNAAFFAPNPREVFSLFYQLLKEEGLLFWHEKGVFCHGTRVRQVLRPDGPHAQFFSRASLENLFRITGFRLKHFRARFGEFHLIAVKDTPRPDQVGGSYQAQALLLGALPLSERLASLFEKPFYALARKWVGRRVDYKV